MAKVELEALGNEATVAELAVRYRLTRFTRGRSNCSTVRCGVLERDRHGCYSAGSSESLCTTRRFRCSMWRGRTRRLWSSCQRRPTPKSKQRRNRVIGLGPF